MRIAIVGAGIVGITTAYELAQDGHEVTVIERLGAVASGTSFANAGVLAPGYVTPWAAPGMPLKVLAGLLSRHAAVRFGARWPLALPWLLRYLRACHASAYERHRRALHALATSSHERLTQISASLDLPFERAQGYLVLLRSRREAQRYRSALAALDALGVRHDWLDESACRAVEPGLSPDTALHAGVHLPDAAVGNCRLFAHGLRQHLAENGVAFRFASDVCAIAPGMPAVLSIREAGEVTRLPFDRVVLCTGHQAAGLLSPLGLKLRLEPVWGYSLTARLRNRDTAGWEGPRAGLMDERFKVAVSRLGDRVRVAGSAELGGHLTAMHPRALATLHRVLDDWFPGQADLAGAQYWKGARPMRPDGPPVIGATGVDGVWVNLGHGSSGWALSCGSARLLADLLAGRSPAVDHAPYDARRMR
jgi:D-amino-acid dehydrogenase